MKSKALAVLLLALVCGAGALCVVGRSARPQPYADATAGGWAMVPAQERDQA